MSNFKKFPSIEQFRNIVKRVNDVCQYDNIPLPTLTFNGTVKLHGTNAGVGLNLIDNTLWVQSRNNIITPEKDNAGFANFVKDNEDIFIELLRSYTEEFFTDEVIVYGEWCGKGIQKNVGISELDKMFVVFGIQVDEHWVNVDSYEYDKEDLDMFNNDGIFFIDQFEVFSVEIDFSNPALVQNKLVELTEYVEKECPVAKAFGVSGIGEGIVWKCNWNNNHLIFKVKGEKHSVSKVKKLASVDPEKIENVNKFVEYACTDNRLEQGLSEVGLFQENIGKFIVWINKDIYKEENDVLESNNLTMKDVSKNLTTKSRNWYLDKLNNF